MKPTLIITADDFGISVPVSQGILDAHVHGIVTATSVLVTAPTAHECLPLLAAAPRLQVGAHLSLTFGRPLSQAGQWLAGDGGTMSPRTMLRRYLLAPRKFLRIVAQEWDTQLAALRAAGVAIAHLDSHHHVHQLPGLARVVCTLAQRYQIPRVRVSDDPAMRGKLVYMPLRWCAQYFCRHAQAAGLCAADYFCGAPFLWAPATAEAKIAALRAVLEPLAKVAGTVELYTHPGLLDATLPDSYIDGRAAELAALTDAGVRAWVARHYAQVVTL